MAESDSWPSISKYGLLSCSALLDLFEIEGEQRHLVESQWRPESVILNHRQHGSAVIRDQKPLRERNLQNLLDGMTLEEYYRLLNGKTFFWVRKERLVRLLNARAYRKRSHSVLTIDTKSLVSKHEKDIWFSHINSGATIFGAGRRGVGTFQRLREYPFEMMRKKKNEDAIVELAVDYAVKDIRNMTIRVEEWLEGKPIRTIWQK